MPSPSRALTALALFTRAGCAASRAPATAPEGWVDLFDGQTLTGWTQRGGAASYTVEDGDLVGRTAPNQPNSFLCTDLSFENFELSVDFRVDPRLNSGIQIRSESRPEYQKGRVHGYQVEIDPSDRAFSGGIYDEGRRGWLADLKANPDAQRAFRQGEWNTLRVLAAGPHIQTWINGIPAASIEDSMTPAGFIALQVHGVGALQEPLEVRWRHIRLRPLSP